jgi:hypothetical protein
MGIRIVKPVISCCPLLGLMALIAGCGGTNPHSVDHAEVTGKVVFQGKPVTGGQVTFVTVKGGFAASGHIEENGNYKVDAPIGEVIITVNNTMLQSRQGGAKKGGGGPPKDIPHPKQSVAEEPPIKGQWMQIPSQYAESTTSDLRYTVTSGAQTHDIELKP